MLTASDAPPCWRHRYGVVKCERVASRFFVSLLRPSAGVSPRNRAVCGPCSSALRMGREVSAGSLREVSLDEWMVADVMGT